MILQAHRIIVPEGMREGFTLPLAKDAIVLHFHHHNLPHAEVELVEMHCEHVAEIVPRRFLVVNSFCTHRIPLPTASLRFVSALTFENHVWNFFEVLASE